MFKKMKWLKMLFGLLTATAVSFIGFGVYQSVANVPHLDTAGYILQSGMEEIKQIYFASDSSYKSAATGELRFTSGDGAKYNVARESFAYLEDGTLLPLSDGILLNFDDLTDNFVNNYYISAGLRVAENGGTYVAQTTAGTMQFGEHLLKLSESRYIVRASSLKVSLRPGEEWPVNDYVQVSTSPDGIVYLLTPENTWSTISEDCYIETANGVKVYPVTQIVDDGTYKLSLAKLNADMDEAIVLTEDETRRQIVPDLNITAVDGEDGENGTDGTAGTAGTAGTSGEDGRDGEAGEQGRNGENGERGTAGRAGSDGGTGLTGADGGQGASGGTGSRGADAVVQSSTNSAIPTMSITDWQVTATGLRGAITISDPSNLLGAIADLTSPHPGSVTVTNTKTGEKIICNEWNEQFDLDRGSAFNDFYTGANPVYFAAPDGALTPDTEYEFSVTAFYTSTDNANIVYSREFINRIFYTDSTGVNLSRNYAEENAVHLRATLSEAYTSSVRLTEVYLLTPEQNRTFTAASRTNPSSYKGMKIVDFSSGRTQNVSFDGLNPNAKYIARVYVETTENLKTLTRQELEVMTLKRSPVWTGTPMAGYNRQTGAVETYRPNINDPDGGAVRYVYTAYRAGTDTADATRTIGASAGEPVEFRLNSDVNYEIGVKMEFNDNEKTVWYDLGRSRDLIITGDTMPKITLIPDSSSSSLEYNRYVGILRVSPGVNSHLAAVTETRALTVELFADGLLLPIQTVKLTSPGTAVPVAGGDLGRMTLASSPVTGNVDIALDLENLYKNTTYSLTLYGWLDIGDGNGEQYRVIGTATFRTKDVLPVTASFTSASSERETATLAMRVRISMDTTDTARADYARSEIVGDDANSIPSGRITLSLRDGIGVGSTLLTQQSFFEEADLAEFFDAGKIITAETFGNPNIRSGASYTITITEIVDASYNQLSLGYTNTYDDIDPASGYTTGVTQPPDLLRDPSDGVHATPIYNIDITAYDPAATVNENLPDDAIVGYVLEAQYDNAMRLATNVKYFVYEANAFLTAMNGLTWNMLPDGIYPLEYMQPHMTMTQPVTDNRPPKVAILFGGTQTASDGDAVYSNATGCMVYYAGTANYNQALTNPSLNSGMGRGFRYVFGYEVEYRVNDATKIYPYGHGEHLTYQSYYGGFHDAAGRKRGEVYVLTSKICDAPLILPDFHTYVAETQEDAVIGTSSATGRLIIHYAWRDPETVSGDPYSSMIKETTNITFKDPLTNLDQTQALKATPVYGATDWYSIALPYSHTKSSLAVLEPKINVKEYRRSYATWGFSDPETMTMGPYLADWSWKGMFNLSAYQDKVVLGSEIVTNRNWIEFYFKDAPGAPTNAAIDLASRATALSLTFSAPDAATKQFLLPVIYDQARDRVCVRVMASELGEEYLEKTYTVTDATLYYDDGRQGWSLIADNQTNFLLQRTNQTEFDAYPGAKASGSTSSLVYIPASGAMSRTNTGTAGTPPVTNVPKALRETIKLSGSESDAKLTFARSARVPGYGGDTTFLYPLLSGVDNNNSSDLMSAKGSTVTVKGVSTYAMGFDTGCDTGSLRDMTPTADMVEIVQTTTGISIRGLKIEGLRDTDRIYMRLYPSFDEAYRLRDSYNGRQRTVIVPASGTVPEDRTIMEGGTITSNTSYHLAIFYEKDGVEQLLIDKKKGDSAIYPVRTSSQNTIAILDMQYTNADYFNKQMIVRFNLSLIARQTIRYDIYSTNSLAVSGGDADVLTHEEMTTAHILSEPSTYGHDSNEIQFYLTPRIEREKLKPATPYYLRITTIEGETESGSLVLPFTLGTVGSYGALITSHNAASNSVTFKVTIIDAEHYLMGYQSESDDSLYAVRFTDANGRRIFTRYDDEVYRASELQKTFELTYTNLAPGNPDGFAISPSQLYNIHIYAVPDKDHDGAVTIGGTRYTWTELFTSAYARFKAILRSFWDGGGNNVPAQDTTEEDLLIETKSQSTTTEEGWILNKTDRFVERLDSRLVRVVLHESFNLIDEETDEHVFKRIDWEVTGTNSAGYFKVSGASLQSSGQKVLQWDSEKKQYYFEIPAAGVPSGTYSVVLQLRRNDDSEAAEKISWYGPL